MTLVRILHAVDDHPLQILKAAQFELLERAIGWQAGGLQAPWEALDRPASHLVEVAIISDQPSLVATHRFAVVEARHCLVFPEEDRAEVSGA